jgi:Tfp pilus assembly protein PilN
MINLIPIEEKKKMVKDFYLRFIVVCLVTLGFLVLIASVALLPSYFFVSAKESVIKSKIENQKSIPLSTPDIETYTAVSSINKRLQIMESAKQNKFFITQKVINEILIKKIPEIKINQITYEGNSVDGKKIQISGSAPSREKLLLFRLALEDNPAFKKVDLPISNFVKGSDINFFITLLAS